MSAARYELLLGRAPGDVIARGAQGARSVAQLRGDVGRLVRRMPQAPDGRRSEAVIACGDRYAFGVALLACWARGYSAALPPSHHPHALRELALRTALVLHDGEAESGLDVREAFAREAVAAADEHVGTLDAGEHAVTLYTSGTTGDPQAVEKTAEQLLGEVEVLVACFGRALSCVLCTLPARHIYGLLFGLLLPIRAGAVFVRETPLHTDAVLAMARRHGVDTLVAVPAHLSGFTAVHRSALGTLQRVFTSGAPLRAEVFDDLCDRLGLSVCEVFGSTETGGIGHRARAAEPYLPFAGVEVEAHADGRMALRSPRLSPGAGQPRLCEDMIELVAGGRFIHLGRADDIVKIGGARVSLGAIERAVRALPNVRDAAVLARALPNTRGHEILLAVAGEGWDAASIRAALHERLQPVAVPRRCRFVDELPREPTGKLRRDNVLALFKDVVAPGELTGPREPVLELERLAASCEGAHARFELRVPAELLYFRGHFDGFRVLPGVAQVGLVAVKHATLAWPELGTLSRVHRLKMKLPIKPDDVIAVVLKRASLEDPSEHRIDFEITRAGEVCTSGTLWFAAERAS